MIIDFRFQKKNPLQLKSQQSKVTQIPWYHHPAGPTHHQEDPAMPAFSETANDI